MCAVIVPFLQLLLAADLDRAYVVEKPESAFLLNESYPRTVLGSVSIAACCCFANGTNICGNGQTNLGILS